MSWERYSLHSWSVVKWQEVTEMFVIVDYVQQMTAKKFCYMYGKYGTFQCLLLF